MILLATFSSVNFTSEFFSAEVAAAAEFSKAWDQGWGLGDQVEGGGKPKDAALACQLHQSLFKNDWKKEFLGDW